jgi:trehalose 6-phosphate synthase
MLATPLRDRATPHAAEYAAARATGRGRLILSEFSSAIRQLPGAIIVNPHEPRALEQAMLAAAADADTATPVMTRMCAHALSDDVTTWAQTFLKTLTSRGSLTLPEPASLHPMTTARRSPTVRLRQEGKPHRAQPADPAGQLATTAHP